MVSYLLFKPPHIRGSFAHLDSFVPKAVHD